MDVTPGARGDDPESSDAAPPALDVTPRAADPTRDTTPGGRRSRTLWAVVGLCLVVGALGIVLFNGLNDASTFFYNVDEAVAKHDDLADRRFRMQGNVVAGTVESTDGGVTFVISYGGEEMEVDHTGDPPELFGPGIPVVLEGRFAGDGFASDEILVRHDNAYDEENPDRIREAEKDADQGSAAGSGG